MQSKNKNDGIQLSNRYLAYQFAKRCLGGWGGREVFSFGGIDTEVIQEGYEQPVSGTISTKNQSGQAQWDGSTTLVVPKEKSIGVIDHGSFRETTEALNIPASYYKGHDNHGARPMVKENKQFEITCNCGKIFIGTLTTTCPECGSIKTGYINEVKQVGTKTDFGTQPHQQDRVYDAEGISPALQSQLPEGAHKIRIAGWHENENIIAAHMDDAKRSTVQEEVYHKPTGVASALNTAHQTKLYGTRIRRLTPVECERLQAYEDGWTEFGIDEKGNEVKISDSQRYKVLGNSVTTSVISAIIERMYD